MFREHRAVILPACLFVVICFSLSACTTTRREYCKSFTGVPCMPRNFNELTPSNKAEVIVPFARYEALNKRYDKAIEYANQAMQLDAENDEAYAIRAVAYAHTNQNDKAIEDATHAIRLNPKNVNRLYGRAAFYIINGQFDRAILDFERISKLQPTATDCLEALAWIYATCHDSRYLDGKKSVEIAQKVTSLRKTAPYISTLAAAYARNGQYEEAVKTQENALAMLKASKKTQPNEVEEAESRLVLYKAGQPYTEPKEKLTLN